MIYKLFLMFSEHPVWAYSPAGFWSRGQNPRRHIRSPCISRVDPGVNRLANHPPFGLLFCFVLFFFKLIKFFLVDKKIKFINDLEMAKWQPNLSELVVRV